MHICIYKIFEDFIQIYFDFNSFKNEKGKHFLALGRSTARSTGCGTSTWLVHMGDRLLAREQIALSGRLIAQSTVNIEQVFALLGWLTERSIVGCESNFAFTSIDQAVDRLAPMVRKLAVERSTERSAGMPFLYQFCPASSFLLGL